MKSNTTLSGFDKSLGQVLEIVPLKDPTTLTVGDSLPFLVLFKGSPLSDAEISVIPRGKALPEMETPPYDFMTDMEGKASFTFTEANYHLIVVHVETNESGVLTGKSYSFTKYTGDLTVIVGPARLPSASSDGKLTVSNPPTPARLGSLEEATMNPFTRAFGQVLAVFNKVSLYLKKWGVQVIAARYQ